MKNVLLILFVVVAVSCNDKEADNKSKSVVSKVSKDSIDTAKIR